MPLYSLMVRRGSLHERVTIVASDPREAMVLSRQYGDPVTQPTEVKPRRGSGMRTDERYIFMNQLATMLIAKVPLSEALDKLRIAHGGRIAQAASGLMSGVRAGKQIADLMFEDKRNFPGAIGLIVKGSAQGLGGAPEALKKAAEFERSILQAMKGGANGLYKAGFWSFTSTVGIFACPFWLTPYLQDSELFKLLEKPVNWNWLDNLSIITGLLLSVFMFMALFLVVVVTIGQRLFPEFADKIIMKTPFVRDIVFSRDNFVSFYRLGLMVKSGVQFQEAISTTLSDTRKGALREDFGRALRAMKEGRDDWAETFMTVGITDRAAMKMAGDKDSLGTIMSELAEQNRRLYERRLEFLKPITELIGGLSMMLVYGIVGLYSIVPFSALFESLISQAYGTS